MAFCALLGVGVALVVVAQVGRGDDKGKGKGKGGGGGGVEECILPAQCVINAPVFNFGRASMDAEAPAVQSNATISVTCTRAAVDGLIVDVAFQLSALVPDAPPRYMRDPVFSAYLAYDLYVDAARTRLWGDGINQGTFLLEGICLLNQVNRVCTLVFPLYGRVPGGQTQVPPGRFLGAVAARLNYQFAGCRVN